MVTIKSSALIKTYSLKLDEHAKAKSACEKALLFMPTDKVTLQNLKIQLTF